MSDCIIVKTLDISHLKTSVVSMEVFERQKHFRGVTINSMYVFTYYFIKLSELNVEMEHLEVSNPFTSQCQYEDLIVMLYKIHGRYIFCGTFLIC